MSANKVQAFIEWLTWFKEPSRAKMNKPMK